MQRFVSPIILSALCTAALTAVAVPAHGAAENGWEYVTTDSNVVVYRKVVPGSDVVAFRGVTYANLAIGKLLAVFGDGNQRKNWVDRYVEHKTFAKSEGSETYWIHFGLPWPVSDRDYVLQAISKDDPENHRVTVDIRSVESADKGPDDCCVRATVHGTFYEFTALPGEEKTKIIVEVHTDPKGSIPTWLVNLIQKSWPSKTLHNLIDYATNAGVPALAAYADWHKVQLAQERREPGPTAPEPRPQASAP
jgi:START domain-containing protein